MPKFESSRLNSGARNEKTYAQYKQTNIGNTLTFSSHWLIIFRKLNVLNLFKNLHVFQSLIIDRDKNS